MTASDSRGSSRSITSDIVADTRTHTDCFRHFVISPTGAPPASSYKTPAGPGTGWPRPVGLRPRPEESLRQLDR